MHLSLVAKQFCVLHHVVEEEMLCGRSTYHNPSMWWQDRDLTSLWQKHALKQNLDGSVAVSLQ